MFQNCGANSQVILVINTQEMLDSFKTHKFAITAESGLVSGPLGTDVYGAVDIKKKVAPLYSYTRSRGFYGGLELTGQVFMDRFDENERFYYWPGIKAGDILDGKVRIPPSVEPLHQALRDAELGISQSGELERLADNIPSGPDTGTLMSADSSVLGEGEKIRLPPTPQQLDAMEQVGIKDEVDEEFERREREEIRNLPPPPRHPDVVSYWAKRNPGTKELNEEEGTDAIATNEKPTENEELPQESGTKENTDDKSDTQDTQKPPEDGKGPTA